MGIEAEIGCLSCKKYIWLGSMKPYKWEGFQIPNKDVYRFLSLHSKSQNTNCKLLYIHDASEINFPWSEEQDKSKIWKEDINSRLFWDSWSNEHGIVCGHCKKILKDKNGNDVALNAIQKSEWSWFCDEICFKSYSEFQRKNRETIIYDSTNDIGAISASKIIEVGCTQCKSYAIINNQEDEFGIEKDYEYFHLFLMEHSFHQHTLVYIGNEKHETPWGYINTKHLWEEHKD